MDRKIRVGAVSYLNTKPLIYGFEKGMMKSDIDLIFDYPANIAQQLVDNEIDIGLVPVAIIPNLKNYNIIGDYCISCKGEVASVCLFSEVPLNEIKSILLDYQSLTSAALLKVLLKEYWKINPVLKEGTANYENLIIGTTAGLVIGDRAFHQRLKSTYIYDLGEAWRQLTGLPFVFAAWISNKQLPADFITDFNAANKVGCDDIETIVRLYPFKEYDLQKYYTENIIFKPKYDKLDVITLFLEKLKAL